MCAFFFFFFFLILSILKCVISGWCISVLIKVPLCKHFYYLQTYDVSCFAITYNVVLFSGFVAELFLKIRKAY